MGNGGLRKSLLRFPKQPVFPHPHFIAEALLNRFCPFGYEDETGFHYGNPGYRIEGDGCRGVW